MPELPDGDRRQSAAHACPSVRRSRRGTWLPIPQGGLAFDARSRASGPFSARTAAERTDIVDAMLNTGAWIFCLFAVIAAAGFVVELSSVVQPGGGGMGRLSRAK